MWTAVKIGNNWFARWRWIDVIGKEHQSDTGPFSSIRHVADFIHSIVRV